MIKKTLLIVSLIFCLCLSGCRKPHTIILFNHSPISKENFLNSSVNFKPHERIYYLFISEKPVKSDYIRIQILKKDEKSEWWGVKIAYANDFKIYKDQVYYYNDYIVLNESGYYYMRVFAKNNLEKPLATASFYVREQYLP